MQWSTSLQIQYVDIFEDGAVDRFKIQIYSSIPTGMESIVQSWFTT